MRAMLDAPVCDFSIRSVVTVDESDTLEVAARQLAARRVGAVVVMHGAHASGLLSERDVVERVGAGVDPTRYTAAEAMTAPLVTACASDSVREVLALMAELGIRHAPIVGADGHLLGMASLSELVEQLNEDSIRIDLGSERPEGASRWFG